MEIKKILVSQPQPSSEKSPYYDIARKYGVELTFKPFIRIEGLTAKEFRQQKVFVPDYTAIVLTSRTAVDIFFKLAEELRAPIHEELQYFCLSETIALYLQKYIVYRKRKVHFSKTGKMEDLAAVMKKHNTEKYLMPVADIHKEDLSIFTRTKVKLTTAVMYRTVAAEFSADEIASYDMLIFFTPMGIQSLFENVPDYVQGQQGIGVFGPATTKAAEERGLRLDIKGPTPEHPSMTSALMAYLEKLRIEN